MDPAAERRLGERGRMPRPLVVVVSGKTQMIFPGLSSVSCFNVVSRDSSGGEVLGDAHATTMALKSVMRSTLRVFG